MISIKRVKVSELHSLVYDPDYPNWDFIPISRHRARSYIQNPRSSPTDVVLYLAYINNQLVGYRTVMPDTIFAGGKFIKVGWLSGNWVNPAMRRQGIASNLFQCAFDDWEGRLLFTNYALESKAVYDKTDKFTLIHSLQGIRMYIRPCFADVLSLKSKCLKQLKFLWQIADFFLSLINPIPFFASFIGYRKGITFEYLNAPDDEVGALFATATQSTPSGRSHKELDWIIRYPWLVSSPMGDRLGQKYHFSSSPKRFDCQLVKVYCKGNLLGFFMTNLHNNFLTTPYIVFVDGEESAFAAAILIHSVKQGARRITVYHEGISKELKRIIPFGWFSLRQQRYFYATQGLAREIAGSSIRFYEGDGDCAFV